MDRKALIEPFGFIVAIIMFLFSLIYFYNDTGVFFGSLSAAVIAAGLSWITYIMLRLVFLTFKS